MPSGFKTTGLFGRPQISPEKPLSNHAQARKRAREEAKATAEAKRLQNRNSDSENSDCSDDDKENDQSEKRKDGSRKNWNDRINIRFGFWIKKIEVKIGREVQYLAGCNPCEMTGATKGLGAKPTKRIKMYTFQEHENSVEHKQVFGHTRAMSYRRMAFHISKATALTTWTYTLQKSEYTIANFPYVESLKLWNAKDRRMFDA